MCIASLLHKFQPNIYNFKRILLVCIHKFDETKIRISVNILPIKIPPTFVVKIQQQKNEKKDTRLKNQGPIQIILPWALSFWAEKQKKTKKKHKKHIIGSKPICWGGTCPFYSPPPPIHQCKRGKIQKKWKKE